MGWIGWIILGLLAGGIAGRLVQGRSYGCLGNIVVGLIGSLVGGYLFSLLDLAPSVGFWGSLLTATVGAVVFLAVLNLLKRD